MKKLLRSAFLCGALIFILNSEGLAISIDFVQANQTVSVGDIVSVEIVVSGLTASSEIVSTYDLDISYDSTILEATGVTFGTYLDDPIFESYQEVKFSPGIIDIAELSFLLDDELADLQGDSVLLATLTFNALSAGSSGLIFELDPLYGIDVKGRAEEINGELIPKILSFSDAGTGNITVEASASPVPEPGTIYLLITGLLTSGFVFRKFPNKR